MNKLILIVILSVFLTGCGVGVYSIQSGYSDVAYVVFTDDTKEEIVVNVDGKDEKLFGWHTPASSEKYKER